MDYTFLLEQELFHCDHLSGSYEPIYRMWTPTSRGRHGQNKFSISNRMTDLESRFFTLFFSGNEKFLIFFLVFFEFFKKIQFFWKSEKWQNS